MRKSSQPTRTHARLDQHDARSLSTLELVSDVLDTEAGAGGRLDLAQKLMAKFRSVRTLARSAAREIAMVRGIGVQAAMRLAGAFELGRRAARETVLKVKVDKPQIACRLVAGDFDGEKTETLLALLLDRKCQLLRVVEISRGGASSVASDPGDIFRPAIVYAASAIILVHNHPSGDPKPSKEDHAFTRRLMKASQLLNVEVFDHIIVGDLQADPSAYYSYKEARKL